MVASVLRVLINSCPYWFLKTANVKLFGKLLKILGRITTFCSYQVFPFEFCKIFINGSFSEHRHGFALAMTYCLQKEKVEKKKVLGGSSCDNLFSIVLYIISSITINLQKKLNFKIMSSV